MLDCLQAQSIAFRFIGCANVRIPPSGKASFSIDRVARAVFAVLKKYLLKKFSRICCLLFSYQCSFLLPFQTTALIDYHIFCHLSTTFFKYFRQSIKTRFILSSAVSATGVILTSTILIVNIFSVFYLFHTIQTFSMFSSDFQTQLF